MTSDSVPDSHDTSAEADAKMASTFDELLHGLLAASDSTQGGKVAPWGPQEVLTVQNNGQSGPVDTYATSPAPPDIDDVGAKTALPVVKALLEEVRKDSNDPEPRDGTSPGHPTVEEIISAVLEKAARANVSPLFMGQYLAALGGYVKSTGTVPSDIELAELSVEIAKISAEVTQEEAKGELEKLKDLNWLPGVVAEGLNFTPDQLRLLAWLQEQIGEAKLLEGRAEAQNRLIDGKVATAPAVVERQGEIAVREATVQQTEAEVDVYGREVEARRQKWGIRRSDPQFLLRVGSTVAVVWTAGAAWVQSTYPWVNRVPYRHVWEVDPLLAAGYAPIAFAKGAGSFVVNVAVIGTDLAEALGGKLAELTGTPASPDVTQGTTVAVEEFSVGGKRVRMTNLRTVSLGLSSEASAVSSRSSSSVDPASLAGLSPHPEAMSAEVALSRLNI